MDKRLIIVGTGMQAAEVHYYLGTLGGRQVDAFLVDPEFLKEPSFLGCPVLGLDAASQHFPPQTHEAFVAIGMLAIEARRRWYFALGEAGYTLTSYVHPSACVASNVSIGANTIVKEMVAVSPFARLGDNLILCPQACIGHHARIGSHGFMAPAAVVAGGVDIGERCFIGAGAIVRDRVRIGDGCIIGAGAVIMEDCPPGGVYRAERTQRTREINE